MEKMEIVVNWFGYTKSPKTSRFPAHGFAGNKGNLNIQAKSLMGDKR